MNLTNGQQAAFYWARKNRRTAAPRLTAIGNLLISSSASNGAAVGALRVANSSVAYTFTLTDDASGAFALSGNSIIVADATKLTPSSYLPISAQAEDGDGNLLSVGVLIHVTA